MASWAQLRAFTPRRDGAPAACNTPGHRGDVSSGCSQCQDLGAFAVGAAPRVFSRSRFAAARCNSTFSFDIAYSEPGGFEGFVAVGEPLDAERLAVAVRHYTPVAEHEVGAACPAPCMAANVDDERVDFRLDDLVQLEGPTSQAWVTAM